MANEFGSNDQWDRVASELRAYRQAQQQAWGEIDNTTLGRFLAGDLSCDERRQIEHALDERPELRKLTDLVRDVLADFEPADAPVPAPPVPAPRILPFPKKQTSRPSVFQWVKKRSGILAAACLLLALSGSLLDTRVGGAFVSSDPERTLTDAPTVAMARTGQQPFNVSFKKPVEATTFQEKAGLDRLEVLNQKIDGLEQQGKYEQALRLDERASTVARRSNLEGHLAFAENREKVAELSQKQGDLDRAYSNLCQAYEIRKKEQGPESKETAKTVRSLATVYAVTINTSDGPKYAAPATKVLAPPAPTDPHFPTATVRPHQEHRNAKELHDRLLVHQDAFFLKQQVVPVMVQGLENAVTEREREQFVQAIGNLGPKAADAAPILTVRLQKARAAFDKIKRVSQDDETNVSDRECCVLLWALGRIGPAADEALPSITAFMNSNNAEVRRTAANSLVRMGPAAEEYLNLYLKVELKDAAPDDGAKVLARDVLKRLDAAKERRVRLGLVVGPANVTAQFGD